MSEPKLSLIESLRNLTPSQVEEIETIVKNFQTPFVTAKRLEKSDLFISDAQFIDFGDILRLHHCFSREPFSKDKFEYALERVCQRYNIDAKLARKGNPGHDITINGIPCSLKSEASEGIRIEKIHISKFMELGKGTWSDKESDLAGLRDQFFHHMQAYKRIFVLRCLQKKNSQFTYELVEIPKSLFEEASKGGYTPENLLI